MYTGTAVLEDIKVDISQSNFTYGEIFPVSISVDTCIPDLVLQLFKEDQLVPVIAVQDGNGYIGSAQLMAMEQSAGQYVWQARSEERNVVFKKEFSVTGMHHGLYMHDVMLYPLCAGLPKNTLRT